MTAWTKIRNWTSYAFGMNTTVSQSKTLVPHHPIPVGGVSDGRGHPISDDSGNQIIAGMSFSILNAIHELSCKVDKMSGTVAQVEADIATLVAANTTTQAALTSIQTIIAGLQAGQPLPQADLDALQAAVNGAQANATAASAIATSTATASST